MVNSWLRWYHGTVNDPKWRVIAKKTGLRIVEIVAIWAALMENASQSESRGTLDGWDPEDVAAALDLDPVTVVTICNAMQGKTLSGDTLTSWEKRNPKREREDDSSQRVQRFRDKKRQVTPSNATKRLEKRREEEKREEGEEGNSCARAEYPEDFEQFWQAYPRRKSKGDAFKAWKKPHPPVAVLIAAIERAKKSYDWTRAPRDGKPGDLIPYPASWLNSRGWEDEQPQPPKPERGVVY